MAAAGVVVANPVIAPRADVKIPAVQLSADSGDPSAMLDPSFLDAIAPAAPESTNPFSVLRQLISSLAADATYLGKNAIVDAFVAGVTAVSQPDLTATTTPFVPPLVRSPEVAASILPGLDLSAIGPFTDLSDFNANLPAVVSASSDNVAPIVQGLVSNVVKDAGFVGGQLVAAAFAAGTVVAAEPKLIGDTLQALMSGDLAGALQTAVKVVTATLAPPIIILNALRAIVEKSLGDVTAALGGVVPALNGTATTVSDMPTPIVTPPVVPAPAPASPLGHAARSGRGKPAVVTVPGDTPATPEVVLTTPQPAAAITATSARAADLTPVSRPSLRDAVESVGKQVGAAVAAAAAGISSNSVDKIGVRGRAGRAAAN